MQHTAKLVALATLLLTFPIITATGCGGDESSAEATLPPVEGKWLEPANVSAVSKRRGGTPEQTFVALLELKTDNTWAMTIANKDGSKSRIDGEAAGTWTKAGAEIELKMAESSLDAQYAGKVPARIVDVVEIRDTDGNNRDRMRVTTANGNYMYLIRQP